MVQMKGDGAAVNEFAATAQMIQPRADVGILTSAPAGVILVVAVDGKKVLAPESHVAADDAALPGVATDDGKRPAHALGCAGDFAGEHPAKRRNCFSRKFRDKFLAHKTTAALHPKTLFGQRGVIGDEFWMRHTIAVGENQVIAGGGGDCFIQDDGFAEAVMRMPDVFDRRGRVCGKFLDEFASRVAGAVVGNQNFIRLARLPPHAGEGLGKRLRLVEGADSCNPGAVVTVVTPYSKNRRIVTILDTDVPGGSGVGCVAMIEVAALMVGDVVQCYSDDRYLAPRPIVRGMFLRRGAPKSLFRPGGSTDVLLFEPGRILFAPDIVANLSRPGIESRFSRGFGQPLVETDVLVRSLVATGAARR